MRGAREGTIVDLRQHPTKWKSINRAIGQKNLSRSRRRRHLVYVLFKVPLMAETAGQG